MLRRLLAAPIAVLLVLAVAGGDGAAQQAALLSVDPPALSVEVDQGAFEVGVTVDDVTNAQGLGGYTLVMRYDPAVVRGRTITDSGFVGSTENPVLCPASATDNENGILAHFCFTIPIFSEPGPTTTEPQVLSRITFEPVSEGTTTLDISETTVIDPQGNNLGATTSNGRVTVRAAGANGDAQPTSPAGDTNGTPAGSGLPSSGDGPDGGPGATLLYVALILVGVGALVALALVRRRRRAT